MVSRQDRPDIPPWQPTTIPALFARVRAERGSREAIVAGSRSWTYDELGERVSQLAHALLSLDVRPGDRVGLWLPNGPEWIACNLAILQIRAICVPMNSRLRPREVDHALGVADLSLLIATESFLSNSYLDTLESLIEPEERSAAEIRSSRYPRLRHVIALEGARRWTLDFESLTSEQPRALGGEVEAIARAARVDEAANIFWTSGSTGEPKGAVTSHEVLQNVWSYSHVLGCDERDRFLIPCPLFYVAGYYWGMLAAILNGACMVPGQLFSAAETLELIERQRATTLIGVASAHLRLLDHPDLARRAPASLRVAYSGGAPLPVEVLRRFRDRLGLEGFSSVYGMTETGGITTMTPPSDELEQAAASIGFALPGFELRYVDPASGRDVPPGSVGELWVRGPLVLKTYFGAPREEIEASFAPEGWFKTGDLISRDAEGRHFFAGRIKDVVKVGGENVAAQEVESVMLSHEAIAEVGVLGIPDGERTEVVVAAVVGTRQLSDEELRGFCRARLSPFKVPKHFIRLADLPHTATGKVAKARLRQIVLEAIKAPGDGAGMP